MKTKWTALAIGVIVATVTGSTAARAGHTYVVAGVKVSLNQPAEVTREEVDGHPILVVYPLYDASTIKVSTTKQTFGYWGGYGDLLIDATDATVKGISIAGSKYTRFYVAGQTYDCRSFKATYTDVGNTDAYGLDVGLGMTSATLAGWPFPSAISLRYGVCFSGCLANDYFVTPSDPKSVDAVLPAAGRSILFDR